MAVESPSVRSVPRKNTPEFARTPSDPNTAFGDFLRDARARRGLTLQHIADATRIPLRHLAALERGDIDSLPSGMYRRAQLRTYADAVGLDKGMAIERFERLVSSSQDDRSASPPETSEPGAGRRTRIDRSVLVGAVVAVAATVSFGLWDRTRQAEEGGRVTTTASRSEDIPLSSPAPIAPPEVAVGATTETPMKTAAETVGNTAPETTVRQNETPLPLVADSRLTVISTPPGARVTINGIGWGVAPLTLGNLPPGDLQVRVTKDGYAAREQIVRRPADGPARTLRITLEPMAASPNRQ